MATLYPLTEAQEGLWYAQAVAPRNPILNTGQYLELRGALDRTALFEAMMRTVAETEALQLRFRDTPDGPRQWLEPSGLAPSVIDLAGFPDPSAEVAARMRADSERVIDLANEPSARLTLFCLGPEHHVLYERVHHLATDGYGIALLTNRIGDHYSHLTADVPPPTRFPPFADVVRDDRAWRASSRRDEAREWWHRKLSTLPEVTGPAGGRAVSADSFIRESQWLSEALRKRLAAYSDCHGLGWPDVLTGLTAAYLARWSAGEAVIGLPFMARLGRPIARIPCMAMNVLPQRIALDEDRATADWLRDLAAEMREARRHGLYRSEYLRRELGLVGGSRRLHGPLVNVQPFDRPPRFLGLDVELHILGAGAVDDLTLTFRGDPVSGLLFEVDANPDLYSPDDVRGHAGRIPEFLERALAAESLADVPTASAGEVAAIEAITSAAIHPVPDTTLTGLIEAQMRATPEALAVRFTGSTLSYAELDRRSAALAGRLADMGAGPGRIVAVALDRSIELPVALLAILRSGAAYLPLDPEHPPDRLANVLGQAGPVVLVTSPGLSGLMPPGTPLLRTDDWPVEGGSRLTPPAADDLAYVIFTSGSTGAPKGVAIEHRAIVNRLQWMADRYGFGASDSILQKTPASFDVSVWEFFLPMITGGQLVMAPPGAHRDPDELAELVRRHGITTMHFVPSMLSALLAAPASAGLSLRRVFCSGEELTADQRDRFHERIKSELHNLYGPTEAAVDVSYWPAAPEDRSNPVPIGWPVWNTRLAVLDDRMRPVPTGLAGNLYLGGAQLARGYLGRPDLTAERFIPDPSLPGERLYATGDLARLRNDGAVEYLGRSDHQVKIRGLRIELGEIEAAILASGLAREAVVLAREQPDGGKRLVAYLVPAEGYRPGLLPVRLAATLPGYMVPSAEVALESMPVTSNGKLNRTALPAPADLGVTGQAAGTAGEKLLARLFAEVLHLPDVPPREADFFELGGDSLSAVRLVLRIGEETGQTVGLGAVFENPVLETMADAIARGRVSDGLGPLILLREGDPATPPLFLIHPAGGLSWGYRHLARLIGPGRRVWGVQHPGLHLEAAMPASLKTLAREYVARILDHAHAGPVHLAGWSVGGIIAHAMAVDLARRGFHVGLVAMLDSYPADAWRSEPEPDPVAALRALLAIAGYDPEAHRDLDTRRKVVAFLRNGDTALGSLPETVLDGVVRTVTDTNRLVRNHHHHRLPADLIHIRAGHDHKDRNLDAAMWAPYCEELEAVSVPFLHAAMTSAHASALIAPIISEAMERHE